MNYDPKKPYNEIPGLPPKDVDLECKEILKKCIEARAALEGLKVAGDLIPNQTVLINIIPCANSGFYKVNLTNIQQFPAKVL
jgi:hypothetical protein